MKNTIRKTVIGFMTIAMVALCVGCSSKGICDECGQEAKLTKYVCQGGMGNAGDAGREEHLCEDCLRVAKSFGY